MAGLSCALPGKCRRRNFDCRCGGPAIRWPGRTLNASIDASVRPPRCCSRSRIGPGYHGYRTKSGRARLRCSVWRQPGWTTAPVCLIAATAVWASWVASICTRLDFVGLPLRCMGTASAGVAPLHPLAGALASVHAAGAPRSLPGCGSCDGPWPPSGLRVSAICAAGESGDWRRRSSPLLWQTRPMPMCRLTMPAAARKPGLT